MRFGRKDDPVAVQTTDFFLDSNMRFWYTSTMDIKGKDVCER
jgi:hypothetical protein